MKYTEEDWKDEWPECRRCGELTEIKINDFCFDCIDLMEVELGEKAITQNAL